MHLKSALISLLFLIRSASSECNYSITINASKTGFHLKMLTVRAYERYVYGNRTAWMHVDTDTESPRVARTGAPDSEYRNMALSLGYDGTGSGSVGLGIDQFAAYFLPSGMCNVSGVTCNLLNDNFNLSTCPEGESCVDDILDGKTSSITVLGTLGPFAYNSIAAVFANDLFESHIQSYSTVYDSGYGNCTSGEGNPYTFGSTTVFANDKAQTSLVAHEDKPRISHSPVLLGEGEPVPFYRPDILSSKFQLDGANSGECSDAYVTTIWNSSDLRMPDDRLYHVIRVVVPYVFVRTDLEPADALFGSYDARYFSVSAHREYYYHSSRVPFTVPNVSWWTINARMMSEVVDGAGHAYIVTLPDADAEKLQQEQGLEAWEAPKIDWGGRKVFVLGLPTNGFIVMRYRDPDPNWAGSPANAPCYKIPRTNRPLTKDSLGVYTPLMYSCGSDVKSLDDFLAADACGSVTSRD